MSNGELPFVNVIEGYYGGSPQDAASFSGAQLDGYPLSVSSLALQSAFLVTSGPARLFGFQIYSNKAAGQFIQLFDSPTAPGSGAVPVAVFTVAATSNLPVAYPWPGRWFNRGIWIANSSTAATLTAGAADCYFDVQYFG